MGILKEALRVFQEEREMERKEKERVEAAMGAKLASDSAQGLASRSGARPVDRSS